MYGSAAADAAPHGAAFSAAALGSVVGTPASKASAELCSPRGDCTSSNAAMTWLSSCSCPGQVRTMGSCKPGGQAKLLDTFCPYVNCLLDTQAACKALRVQTEQESDLPFVDWCLLFYHPPPKRWLARGSPVQTFWVNHD